MNAATSKKAKAALATSQTFSVALLLWLSNQVGDLKREFAESRCRCPAAAQAKAPAIDGSPKRLPVPIGEEFFADRWHPTR